MSSPRIRHAPPGGAPRPAGPRPDGDGPSARTPSGHVIDAVLSASVDVLCAASARAADRLEAETLGSDASGIWWAPSCEYGAHVAGFERRVGRAYAAVLEARGGGAALAALRALQVGASDGIAAEARPVAERLARAGAADPAWWGRSATIRPVRAARLSEHRDARTRVIFLEIERAGERQTLGALIAPDRSGVIDSIGVFAGIDAIQAALRTAAVGDGTLDAELHPLAVTEARRGLVRAIERTDLLGTPEDHGHGYAGFRGLAQRWLEATGASPIGWSEDGG